MSLSECQSEIGVDELEVGFKEQESCFAGGVGLNFFTWVCVRVAMCVYIPTLLLKLLLTILPER